MIRFPELKAPQARLNYGDTQLKLMADKSGFNHLQCSCQAFMRKDWCAHVQHFYTDVDTEMGSCGSDPEGLQVYDPAPAVVVFKGDPWLIVPCVVTPVDDSDVLMKVDALWGNARRESKDSYTGEGGQCIGFIESMRDGRAAIRRLLLEWLPTLPYLYDMKCTSLTHTEGDSHTDQVQKELFKGYTDVQKKDTLRWVYADAFNILDTGTCYSCDESAYIDVDTF